MQIIIPKLEKIDIFIGALFLALIIWYILFLNKKLNDHNEDMKEICKYEINGKITGLRDQQRGSYFLEIKTLDSIYEINSLPFAWYVKEHNIMIGDSVSKSSDSKIMIFHKVINGKYKEILRYEIYYR